MKGFKRSFVAAAVLSVALTFPVPYRACAQEVRLRPGDRVELSVPQRSELDRRLLIDESGRVNIPIVGEVEIGGMSLGEARAVLLRKLREIYPSVQTVTLNLAGEESGRVIYVHGAVLEPGKYGFEKNPTVWEAIREAGGATSTAALDVVRIVRAGGEGPRTQIIDLQSAIESGNLDDLPILRPGDAVIVSESTTMHATTGSVRVIGAVRAPGPYILTGDKTLIDAILAAGGGAETANLKKVTVIRNLQNGSRVTMTFDFKRYLEKGDIRHNPNILPGDTVNVPARNQMLAVLASPTFWLAAITAYGAVYAMIAAGD